jgi:hypothetical protein
MNIIIIKFKYCILLHFYLFCWQIIDVTTQGKQTFQTSNLSDKNCLKFKKILEAGQAPLIGKILIRGSYKINGELRGTCKPHVRETPERNHLQHPSKRIYELPWGFKVNIFVLRMSIRKVIRNSSCKKSVHLISEALTPLAEAIRAVFPPP